MTSIFAPASLAAYFIRGTIYFRKKRSLRWFGFLIRRLLAFLRALGFGSLWFGDVILSKPNGQM
jgi:hypothetical protein